MFIHSYIIFLFFNKELNSVTFRTLHISTSHRVLSLYFIDSGLVKKSVHGQPCSTRLLKHRPISSPGITQPKVTGLSPASLKYVRFKPTPLVIRARLFITWIAFHYLIGKINHKLKLTALSLALSTPTCKWILIWFINFILQVCEVFSQLSNENYRIFMLLGESSDLFHSSILTCCNATSSTSN